MPSYTSKAPQVLLIGPQLAGLAAALSCPQFDATGAASLDDAPSEGVRFAALALELGSGLDSNKAALLAALRKFRCPVLAVTPQGDVAAATGALRNGAADALPGPPERDSLDAALKNFLSIGGSGKADAERRTSLGAIIGSAPCMQELYRKILSVGSSEATVFIQGPSGTGKELVARAIHLHSPRADGPFEAVNCGAIPPSLLESELFGHERGAFTGAVARHEGRFERADGGTLFLDEVTELPLDLQVKLLRVLQEMAVSRVGGRELIPVDVRIVCATNRDVRERLARGLFREDLYYRLNVVPVRTPPLSERRQDIPLLLNHFLSFFAEKYRKGFYDFSIGAMSRLCAYDWPGNVREMENMVERMVVLNDGAVVEERFIPEEALSHEHAPGLSGREEEGSGLVPHSGASSAFLLPPMPVSQAEAGLIRGALGKSQGNVVQASRILQIGQATLYRKMKRYAIDPKEFRLSRKVSL